MKQLTLLLNEVVKNWRIGNDQKGLQDFIQSIYQIEQIINIQLSNRENNLIKIADLKRVLENFYLLIKNNDVIGITDVIEFQLIPLIQAWEESEK